MVGLKFAVERWAKKRGCIIADDPGSGKTLQALAFASYLITRNESGGPVLVLVPSAVLKNWHNEFMPDLTVVMCPTEDKQSSKRVIFLCNFKMLSFFW